MTENPDEINDADRQLEDFLWKIGQSYAARNARSKTENEGRAKERASLEEYDLDANAIAKVIELVKKKSPREIERWERSFKLGMKVLRKAQQEMYPEEYIRATKREADRKEREKEAAEAAKKQAAADAPGSRSDPKSGGAGKVTAKNPKKAKAKPDKPSVEEQVRAAGISAEPGPMAGTLEEQEAAEGEAVFKSLAPESQSAQAAAIRDKLGLDG